MHGHCSSISARRATCSETGLVRRERLWVAHKLSCECHCCLVCRVAKYAKMYRAAARCMFYVMCFMALKSLSVATQ